MKSAPSLLLDIRPSRIEIALVAGFCVFAIVAGMLSDLPVGVRLATAAIVVFAAAIHHHRRGGRSIRRCALQSDGTWLIDSQSGSVVAQLVDSRDLGVLIALSFKPASGRRVDLGLWPDSIPNETRRRLRIWLNGTGATTASRY